MDGVFRIVTLVSALLLVLFILIQSRGASLGAGFGGSSEIHVTRRGVDKTVHQITIILALVFALSIILGIVLGA
jgi:preprotein translocase subunit SecG